MTSMRGWHFMSASYFTFTMRYLLVFLTIQISVFASAQKVIHCVDKNNNAIIYASIYDTSEHKISGFTDNFGNFTIKTSSKVFNLTHVSFTPFLLDIKKSEREDTINIIMSERKELMEEVFVKNISINKKKYFQIGTFKKKTSSGFIFRQKLLIGFKFPTIPQSENQKIIRSIRFVLGQTRNLDRQDFIVEIKIYKLLEDGLLDSFTLNKKPIYLNSSSLKKKNEIFMSEDIKLPSSGVFFSFELPEIMDDNYDWTILFKGSFDSEKALTYAMRNHNGYWDENVLLTGGYKPKDLGYFQPEMSITYWNSKK